MNQIVNTLEPARFQDYYYSGAYSMSVGAGGRSYVYFRPVVKLQDNCSIVEGEDGLLEILK